MISLFYIAYLVSVSSLPINLLPKRNANQSLVGLRVTTTQCDPGALFCYWLSSDNIKSGDIRTSGICGSNAVVAMPKTAAEQSDINQILNDNDNRQTWNGKYAWLGGKYNNEQGCWEWFDGTPVTSEQANWDTNEPGTSGDGSGDPPPLSYQPFLGLVRKAGSNQGKWHDFHGQDQGNGGKESTVGQVAVCQQELSYWVTSGAIATNGVTSSTVPDSVCGDNGVLAMPKTVAEQDRVCDLLDGGLGAPISGLAWGGAYLWLGGHYNGNRWEWNDGTPVTMPVSSTEKRNWDTNEPGTVAAYTASDPLAYQPLLGIKRENGKFHDFHGQDQGSDGQESSVGFLALCQGYL